VHEQSERDERQDQSGTRSLVQFLWMVVGVIGMAFSTAFIIQRDALGVADACFWAAAALMAAARLVDVLCLAGETFDGRPATSADLRRYLILMPLAATVIWIGAHALARAGWLG
jgi:hypothetical protein